MSCNSHHLDSQVTVPICMTTIHRLTPHPSSHKNKKKKKKERKSNMVGRVTHRFCIHRCLLCNRISIRFWNSGLRVTRYPVKTSERGIPRAATKLTLADSQAYRSEFRGGYLENPCSRAGSVLIGLMKLRFMTDSRCWLLPAIFSVRPPLKLNPPPFSPLPFHSSLEYMLQLRVNSFSPAFPSLLYFFYPLFLSFFFFSSRSSLIAPLEL